MLDCKKALEETGGDMEKAVDFLRKKGLAAAAKKMTAMNGDIVVALVDGEATVKRFFLEAGRVRLQPENRTMQPIMLEGGDLRIVGKVVGVMRKV